MPLTIKDDELKQLQTMLDLMPHGLAKKLEQFFGLIQQKRNVEAAAAKAKEDEETKKQQEDYSDEIKKQMVEQKEAEDPNRQRQLTDEFLKGPSY